MIALYEMAAVKSYDNALDLQKDAKLLYDKRRYARAYALSILSIEELSKAFLFKALSEGTIERQDRLLQKGMLNHRLKIEMIAFMLGTSNLSSATITYLNKFDPKKEPPPAFVIEDITRLVRAVENFKRLAEVKLRALYVDIEKNGKVISPKSEITKENSQMVVYLAEEIIKANPLDIGGSTGRSRLLSLLVSNDLLPLGKANHNHFTMNTHA